MANSEAGPALLMTAEELAEFLRVTRKAVYEMVHKGEVPGVIRLGRRLRFRRESIDRWIEEAS